MIVAMLGLFVVGCGGQLGGTAQGPCGLPQFRTFGVADNFAGGPDPIPYNPASPQFVTFLNNNGIATANMKTFDDQTINRHMVATLRHGLRNCFGGANALTLCFLARSSPQTSSLQTGNDSVTIYNTDFTNNTFPVVYSSAIAPTLTPTWNPNTTAGLCINLTTQMQSNQIGDMLQFRVQDDTSVDYIAMFLF